MVLKYGLLVILIVHIAADKDDKKWVWDSNSRNAKNDYQNSLDKDASARYEIYEPENERPFQGNNQFFGGTVGLNRPDYDNRPFGNRPVGGGSNQRPGGVYGSGNLGSYGQGPQVPQGTDSGVLTGPVPSWEKEGPYKEFDRCKCAERFNCNSPGIAYGHCDVGKQYCCYNTKKGSLGGPPPSRPIHSVENGILVGPGGPFDRPPRLGGGYRPPLGGRPGSFGLGGRPGNYGPIGGRPIHSPENGVLVGPGGPFDRPFNRPGLGGNYGGFGSFERSAKKA